MIWFFENEKLFRKYRISFSGIFKNDFKTSKFIKIDWIPWNIAKIRFSKVIQLLRSLYSNIKEVHRENRPFVRGLNVIFNVIANSQFY